MLVVGVVGPELVLIDVCSADHNHVVRVESFPYFNLLRISSKTDNTSLQAQLTHSDPVIMARRGQIRYGKTCRAGGP